MSNAGHKLYVTTWAHPDSRDPASESETTWGGIVQGMKAPKPHASAATCPLLKLASFGPLRTDKGSRRSDANLLKVYGLEGDYDAGEVSIEEAAARLRAAAVEAVLYTSKRHTPDKPRWRVLAPLSKAVSPAERAALMDALNGALGGILARESWTASQIYYYGRLADAPYECRHVEGYFLDSLADIGLLPQPIGPDGAATESQDAVEPARVPDLDRAIRKQAIEAATADTIADLQSALAWLAERTERARDYQTWIETGQALASLKGTAFEGDAFALWDGFSASVPDKYDPEDADRRWSGMKPSRITFRSVFQWAQAEGWTNPATGLRETAYTRDDSGNADLMRELAKGDLLYVEGGERFIFWTGQQWNTDTDRAQTHIVAKQVGAWYEARAKRTLAEMAGVAGNDKAAKATRNQLAKAAEADKAWARQCRDKKRLSAMIDLYLRDPAVRVRADKLDGEPLLLGVQNGVVDLRTGQLRANARDEFVTQRCAADFYADASAPNWERFVAEVTGTPISAEFDAAGNVVPGSVGRFEPRPDVARYLQKAIGYWATGRVSEQKLYFLQGAGSNGKNVLLDTIKAVLGDYATTIPVGVLMAQRFARDGEAATPTLATLRGKRLALSSETKDGQTFDEQVIKSHTGDGTMAGRAMYGDSFNFEPTHKLVVLGNREPALADVDAAMRGRISKVDFLRRWNRPGEVTPDPTLPNADPALLGKLKAEAPGILAWIVRGAQMYLAEGLKPPAAVVGATREYLDSQDPVSRWIKGYSRCSPETGTAGSDLFADFNRFMHEDWEGGNRAATQTAFGLKLKGLGIAKHDGKTARRWGLRKIEGANRAAG